MNLLLKYLLVCEIFWMLAIGLFGPIYAIFVQDIGGDILEAGAAYASYSLAAGIMVLAISKWEDHVKHKEKIMILSYVIGAIGMLGYIFISNPIHLFIVQAVLGVAQAIGAPAWCSMYSTSLDEGKFASEWGLYDGVYYIMAAVSAASGGLVASILGFTTLFFVMFAFSVISIAISLKIYYLNREISNL